MTSEHVALAEVADVRRGTVPANTRDSGDGPRFFGLAEISSAGQSMRYPEPDTDLSKAVYLQEGDVVLALMGRLGESAILKKEHVGAVLGRECAALRLKPGENRLTAGWLYAWTQSSEFRAVAERNASGTTMPRLPMRALEEFEVPLVPLAQQRQVGELLERFDQAARATNRSVELLRRLRSTEIDLALTDPRTAEARKGTKPAPVRKIKRTRRA